MPLPFRHMRGQCNQALQGFILNMVLKQHIKRKHQGKSCVTEVWYKRCHCPRKRWQSQNCRGNKIELMDYLLFTKELENICLSIS